MEKYLRINWMALYISWICYEEFWVSLSQCLREWWIGKRGSFTAQRVGIHNKADATFGPLRDTPNRNNPPKGIHMVDWVTFSRRTRCVSELDKFKRLQHYGWASYPGIQYVICIKLSPKARNWRYRLYQISELGVLPIPQIDQHFSGSIAAGMHVICIRCQKNP
jgi:hypothetical protein